MPGRKAPPLVLSDDEQVALAALIRRYTAPHHLVLRARVIVAAATGQTNGAIAQQLGRPIDFVRRWRQHWQAFHGVSLTDLPVEDRLADIPRPGRPSSITPEQVCQIVALACAAPSASGRPISQWSGTELADEIVRQGIVTQISPRHALRLLKKGISNPTRSAIG